MTQTMKPAAWWMDLSAAVIRQLPRGRYVAMNALCTYSFSPFVARLRSSQTGLRFECDVRNGLVREAYFMGQYEPQETCLLRELLRPGDTFFDVGANWGYFSLLAAEQVGTGGKVVSIEADPRIFAMLERNVALNPMPQVKALHVAAADGPGTLKLAGFEDHEQNWGISRVVANPSGSKVFEVPARAVDAIADELGVSTVHLLKMDIEGAEAFALSGMAKGLARHRYRAVLLELHPQQIAEHGTTAEAVCQRFVDAGYRGWRVRHTQADTRRAAYARTLRPADVLVPAVPGEALDEWPHVLWLAPGVAAPWAPAS